MSGNPLASWRDRETVLAALFLVIITALALRPEIRGFDGGGNYAYLMSLIADGDLDFHNEYRALDVFREAPYKMVGLPRSEITGRWSNQFGFGAAVFWAPAVIAVHLGSLLSSPAAADLLSPPYILAVALSSALWTSLGLLLLFRRLRRDFGAATALHASAGILLATPLIFYGWMHGSMSHGVGFFVAVVFLLQLERTAGSASRLRMLELGVLGALLFVTRYQDAVWVAAVGGVAIWNFASERHLRVQLRAMVLFGLGAAIILVPQLAIWNHLYGSWLSGPTPHMDGLQWIPRHLLDVLFSERGGFLAWHPILLLGLAGLVACRNGSSKPVWTAAILGLSLQLYLISSWSGWWGGASFGNRFFISSYPWLAVGLAATVRSIGRRWRWSPTLVVVLLSLWNGGLLVQYGLLLVPRSGAISWATVFTNQFTVVPTRLLESIGL
jgi:hypothetical protein